MFSHFSFAKVTKCNIEEIQQGELAMDLDIAPIKGILDLTKDDKQSLPVFFKFNYEGADDINDFTATISLIDGTIIHEGMNNGKRFKIKRRAFRSVKAKQIFIYVEIKPARENILFSAGEHRVTVDFETRC